MKNNKTADFRELSCISDGYWTHKSSGPLVQEVAVCNDEGEIFVDRIKRKQGDWIEVGRERRPRKNPGFPGRFSLFTGESMDRGGWHLRRVTSELRKEAELQARCRELEALLDGPGLSFRVTRAVADRFFPCVDSPVSPSHLRHRSAESLSLEQLRRMSEDAKSSESRLRKGLPFLPVQDQKDLLQTLRSESRAKQHRDSKDWMTAASRYGIRVTDRRGRPGDRPATR